MGIFSKIDVWLVRHGRSRPQASQPVAGKPGETRGQLVMSLAAAPRLPAVPDPPSEVQEIAANVSSTQSAM
jgi:hypothetical protein